MDKTFCNPLNLAYRYQHFRLFGKWSVFREGADPTLICFNERYYLFVSMAAGFWYSDDLVEWRFHENKQLLIYDYAPDAQQVGEYLYFCASRPGANGPILRTKDPLSDQFEQVSCAFQFWDPAMFRDDDGRVYFYWGCSATEPIYGVELDPQRMTPITEKVALLKADPSIHGFERLGEDCDPKRKSGLIAMIFSRTPFTEGAFVTKQNGRYYLQYATPGTEYNTYADGVYVSDSPLGPFTFASHNPFSSKPGGFITAAGHGSTIQDRHGNWWHAATMRISVNNMFERRVGLFPAGFDADGVLFCNQNFADYPLSIPDGKFEPWDIAPQWMLLSYKKPVTASSAQKGHAPELAVNEDIRTWWSATSNRPGEYLQLDLGEPYTVHAIQVNLADDQLKAPKHPKEELGGHPLMKRHIETQPLATSYTLEGSLDGTQWFVLEDTRAAHTDLPHDLFIYPKGKPLRYLKLTGYERPYQQALKVSGLRVFGKGNGQKPAQAVATAQRTSELSARLQWQRVEGAQGYNVRYGVQPDKLYLSWLVYDATELELPTLNTGSTYFVCVDSFNENGITAGNAIEIGRFA